MMITIRTTFFKANLACYDTVLDYYELGLFQNNTICVCLMYMSTGVCSMYVFVCLIYIKCDACFCL